MSAPSGCYRFGPYLLDPDARVLYRDGAVVALTPKAVQLLALLVENAGRVVDKQEIFDAIWPETFVGEACLAKNISTLRKALGDSTGNRLIETVPKRGYRFVGETVRCGWPVAGAVAGTEGGAEGAGRWQPGPEGPRRASRFWMWPAALAVAVVLSVLTASLAERSRGSTPAVFWRPVPLTSESGRQSQPALSPDGKLLAYAWETPGSPQPRLFVKHILSGRKAAVSEVDASGSRPCWFPDSRRLAYLREDQDGPAWFLHDLDSGSQQFLVRVNEFPEPGRGGSPCVSPDGRFLAYSERSQPALPVSIHLLQMDNLSARGLTQPPAGVLGDFLPAWSPDGEQLAFVRAVSFTNADLFVLHLRTGQLLQLTRDAQTIDGLAWSRDSSEVLFSSRRSGGVNALWAVPRVGGAVRQIVVGAVDALSPTVSLQDGKLAYAQSSAQFDLWRFSPGTAAGDLTGRAVVESAFRDSDPDVSPDGKQIAFVSQRSGGYGIWVAPRDGSDAHLLFDGGANVTGSPRWSPDGRWIAFDSRSGASSPALHSIWIISADGKTARRLVTEPAGAYAPAWSRDGRRMYYSTARSGRDEVWSVSLESGKQEQVTRNGGFEAMESVDGKYLYFTKERRRPGIWRAPVAGGPEEFVTADCGAGAWRSWRVTEEGICFPAAGRRGNAEIHLFEFRTRRCRRLLALETPLDKSIPSLAVEPAKRSFLVARYSQLGGNIIALQQDQ